MNMQGITILAASTHPTINTGNAALDLFLKGGPVMYPITLVSLIAGTVILERVFWWLREGSRKRTATLNRVYDAVQEGDLEQANSLSEDSSDPRLRVVWQGLNHQHDSMQGALQLAAAVEIQRASRFLTVMDTIVTLAPLLGLLGTVTGIMRAFNAVSESGLDPGAVSSGIGEALIATAFGLGIAMVTLIPFNYYTSKVQFLAFELETAATNLEVMTRALSEKKKAVSETAMA
ncbi:MAG TPA: MotA/TolQ/ExbB proton channel family protein [Chthoniobacteraceae bacterium]|jgi:biopolymer transport protein ExbB|nr:MotA/TolQ/ExbB proton channel family protein [Chthoniobacteraceae bacterium]